MIALDEDKFAEECAECEDFAHCTWETTLALLREILGLIDQRADKKQKI